MKKTRNVIIVLACSNIVTLLALCIVAAHYNIPSRVLSYFTKETSSIAHASSHVSRNRRDAVRRSYFNIYKSKNVKIVMLGDSITHQIDWNELLLHHDVVNRGIGKDTTENILNRLEDVYALNPEVCCIMCGINDLSINISVDRIFKNYICIVENINRNSITPIIQSTLYLSEKRDKYKIINKKIDALNNLLKVYAKEKNIIFIDVNKELATKGWLSREYTYDGKHLVGLGYEKWKNVLVRTLKTCMPDSLSPESSTSSHPERTRVSGVSLPHIDTRLESRALSRSQDHP